MNIFLIGLMGSGKSYWAHKIGAAMHITALDLDAEIEKQEGKTVAQIFAENGEAYFRLKENEVLKSFGNKSNFILATGGGAPCFHDNIDWMNASGITIWIDEPLSIIAARLRKGKLHRPLIANIADEGLENFFYDMREKRMPYYSKAKHHLNSGNLSEKHFLEIFSLYE